MSKPNVAGLFVTLLLIGIAVAIAASALYGWILMLMLDVLHTEIEAVPPLGFVASWAFMIAVTVIGQALREVSVIKGA